MKKNVSLLVAIILLCFTACSRESISSSGTSSSGASSPTAESDDGNTADRPSEQPQPEGQATTAQEIADFLVQLDEYARTGDSRLADHILFEEEDDEEGLRAILGDDTARQLWCASYAPTTWYIDAGKLEDVNFGSTDTYFAAVGVKTPQWMYLKDIHNALSGCASYTNDPSALMVYFADYAKDIPYCYENSLTLHMVDDTLKVEQYPRIDPYLHYRALYRASRKPTEPFEALMEVYEFTTEMSGMKERDQSYTEYYRLLADNQFVKAFEYVEQNEISMTFYDSAKGAVEKYQAMSAEDQAKVQAEIDTLPKGEFHPFSQVGPSRLSPTGILITYQLYYDSSYEIFGEDLPVYEKAVFYCYDIDNKPAYNHFVAFADIMRHIN